MKSDLLDSLPGRIVSLPVLSVCVQCVVRVVGAKSGGTAGTAGRAFDGRSTWKLA